MSLHSPNPIPGWLLWIARYGAGKSLRSKLRLILAVVTIAVMPHSVVTAQRKDVRRVLVLNELSPLASPAVALVDQSILAGLRRSRYQIELYTETLETTLFPEESSQRQFREFFIRKYLERKPDVIIAAGPTPLRFMVESHNQAFPHIPVVFCGSTEEMLGNLRPGPDFTGVWGVVQPEKTLNVALRLLPETRHVVVVGGVGTYDRRLEAIAKESFRHYESSLDFTYLTELDMPALLEQLKHLPSNTIVYHTSIMQDASGARFIDGTQSVPMVAGAANAPVFVVDDVDLHSGTVGGDLLSFAMEGQAAAEITTKILEGASPQTIPVLRSPNAYMFDWKALKRWGLEEKNLPPGSIILNRQPSVWEAYKWYIVDGIAVIVLQTLLILALLWQRKRRRKAETELVITNDRLRLAVEAGRSVGWDWDVRSGRIRRFGDLETVYGIPSVSYFGHVDDFQRSVHSEDREMVWKAVGDAKESRKPYVAEFRVVRPDGAVRWLTARGKFYYGNDGNAERMLGMALDITDRKQIEEKLHASEKELSGIVSSAMDAIIAIDEQQRIVLFNAAAEKMFGCAQSDARGSAIDRFIPQRFRAEHQEHIRRFGESGVTTRAMRALGALWAVRTNGEEFPIEASISHVESEGKGIFTVIIRDVTARLQAEAAVRESERRFRLVANTAPVMIWMSGPDKLCNYFNQPWLDFTGRPVEDQLGNGWADGVHPDDLQSCLDTYMQAFDLRKPFKMQYRLRRHDGEFHWVFDTGVPRYNSDGSFAGYIGSCIDVTERKLAEEALASLGGKLIAAQEQERTRIARELHDDVNQQLAFLSVSLDVLRQDPPNSIAEIRSRLESIQRHTYEISTSVQALSHRLHSSKLEYLGLVAAIRGFCREFSDQYHVEARFVCEQLRDSPPKEISLCLFRVMQAALINALKHSGVKSFNVYLRGTTKGIHLAVQDRGVGFDAEKMLSGYGIGLISMRERVRLVNGKLSIQSKPNAGTTIEVDVPLAATIMNSQSA